MLCETIGARPTGSDGNKKAVEYVSDILESNGFNVFKQEFDCIDWKNSGAELLIDNCNVQVVSAEYSLPCDIDTEFICVNTIEALKQLNLSDKIAILYGDLCSEPLMPKNFEFYNPDEHKMIISLLEEKNPLVIIFISPHKEHIIQDGDFEIPCAIADVDHLEIFLKASVKTAHLKIKTKRTTTKSHNVIASFGTSCDKICFSAHIDTKPSTPGALDNASGIAVLLTLAEVITDKAIPYQIEIALLNGEDYYSTPGEVIFMKRLGADYKLAVNVDGVGLKGSSTSVSFYECSENLENTVMNHVGEITGIERIEPWPMGDHMIFAMNNIPTIAITASEIFDLLDTVIHSPDDNIENIDFNILDDIVCLINRMSDI